MLENINDLLLVSQAQETQEPYYETLESITFNKTQMFWLPVKPAPDVKIDITFKSNNTSETQCLIGGRINASGSNRKMFAFWECVGGSSSTSGYMRADYGNSSTASNDIGLSSTLTEFRNFVKDGADNYIDGVKKTSNTGTLEEDVTNTYIALGCMSNGTESSYSLSNPFSGDVAQLKIWKAGTQIADYVPVLDSKMQPCLYNRITKEFLYAKAYPSGSTTTYDLGFKRWNKYDVDYIENTGTAYIPFADITPTATMGMNIEYAYTVLSASEPAGVIGTYNGDTQRKDTFFVSTSSGSTQKASSPSSASCGVMVFHRGGNVGTSSTSSLNYIEPEKDVWYTATVNWLGDGEITWTDGTNELSANVGENTVMTNQLRLFSRCNSSNNTYNNCKCRVRKLQFSDGSNIIRSYIPVVWHNSDTTAIATLYDEVYNKMATPTGSLKAYITTSTTAYTLNDGVQNNDYYLAENGTKTVSSDHTSCYSNAFAVKQGDIVEWTVTAEQVSANKRIHGYTTNADIEVGTTGSWVEMLAKIVFSTTSDTTQKAIFTVPSGINYIRLSHANVRESECNVVITRTYEVGSNCSVQTATSNYFNSGLYGNEKWNVRLIAFTPTNTTGQLFGVVRGADYTENLTINSAGQTGGGSLSRFDSKVTTQSDVVHMNANQKSLLQINKYGLFQDSTTVMSWSNPDTFTTQLPCHICKVNGSTGIRPNGCCYIAIEEDNVLIAEFIPVKNKTVTTETGLYDRVNGTLNTGIGTHTFNALS